MDESGPPSKILAADEPAWKPRCPSEIVRFLTVSLIGFIVERTFRAPSLGTAGAKSGCRVHSEFGSSECREDFGLALGGRGASHLFSCSVFLLVRGVPFWCMVLTRSVENECVCSWFHRLVCWGYALALVVLTCFGKG